MDGKMLITQTGGPDNILALWNWEKNKIITSVRVVTVTNTEIRQIAYNSFDRAVPQICVLGHNVFKLFRFIDGQLKQYGSKQEAKV
jgi:hypothetical protein